jgi:uncharacterized membrane protein YdbT with pleckstrin-like domain
MFNVDSSLMPDEHVIHTAKVHRSVFIPGLVFLAIWLMQVAAVGVRDNPMVFILFYVAGFLLVRAQLIRMTTGLAVTTKRVIAKFGVFRHHSIELNLSKVESVEVVQGIFGRMLGYGTISINGTGGVRTPIKDITGAVEFRRNAVAVLHATQSLNAIRSRAA